MTEIVTRKDLIDILADIGFVEVNGELNSTEPAIFMDIRGLDFESNATSLHERKLIKGVKSNLFGLQSATKEMIATIALRLMGFDDPNDFVYAESVEVLRVKGVALSENMTKEDVKVLFEHCMGKL